MLLSLFTLSLLNLSFSGPANDQTYNNMVPNNKVPERKLFVQNLSTNHEALKDKGETQRQHEPVVCTYTFAKLSKYIFNFLVLITQMNLQDVTSASRKPKAKKKASDATFLPTEPDDTERQGSLFCFFGFSIILLLLFYYMSKIYASCFRCCCGRIL